MRGMPRTMTIRKGEGAMEENDRQKGFHEINAGGVRRVLFPSLDDRKQEVKVIDIKGKERSLFIEPSGRQG